MIGNKMVTKQLMCFHFLNKYMESSINMMINSSKTIAYVQAGLSTSLNAVSKAKITYIVRLKLHCKMVR